MAYRAQRRRGGACRLATDRRRRSPPRPRTRPMGSRSPATSTPTAPIAPRWRPSTPAARSRPPSLGCADRPADPPCRSNASRRVGASPARLVGAILARDLTVAGQRWSKGRRLTRGRPRGARRAPRPGDPVTVLVPEPGELHEDDAAIRLAAAVAGPGLTVRGPTQSRVDLLAEAPGVAERPGRGARTAQPDRPARGLHRVRRPGRREGRPRRERQGRAAPGRCRHGRRRGPAGRVRQPPDRLGRPVPARAGRGHRQGIGPRDGARPVRGERAGQDRGSRLGDRRHRLRGRRRGGGRGRDGRASSGGPTRST